MEISDAIVNVGIALIGGAVGGIITGIFTLKATDKAIRDANEKERHHEEKEIQNLLDALGVEIKALWGFHMKRIGEKVEQLPAGKPLEFYYPLTQDYFTIYNANAMKIGAIKDPALRETIVICYNKCKKVVDGFKYNNELLREARASGKNQDLNDYANTIKEDHFELKGYVERLLTQLDQRLA